MKIVVLLCVLITLQTISIGQTLKTDQIINQHLNSTSKSSWADLKTMEESGVTIYADSTHSNWESLKSGTQKRILSFNQKDDSITIGENTSEIWRIKNGKITKTAKLYTKPSSNFNFSYALDRREIEGSFCVRENDTTINNTPFYVINFREKDNFTPRLLYFNSQSYRLEFIEFKGKTREWIEYSDFVWIDNYLFPLTSISFTEKRFNHKTHIQSIKVNVDIDDEVFLRN